MDFWVFLVIRTNHGQYLAVPMKEEEARTDIHDWLEGKLGTKSGLFGRAAQPMPDGSHMAWGVQVDEIVLMHSAPYTEDKQAQNTTPARKVNPQWGGNLPYRKSGN